MLKLLVNKINGKKVVDWQNVFETRLFYSTLLTLNKKFGIMLNEATILFFS